MAKQNYNKGMNTEGPHRQGDKGGKGGAIKKAGEDSSRALTNAKTGKGAGTLSGGESGGKHTGGTERMSKTNPTGKGSGNR